jgi:hypothetical protein
MQQGARQRFSGLLTAFALCGLLHSTPGQTKELSEKERRSNADAVFKKAKAALKSDDLKNANQLFQASNSLLQQPRTLRMLATVQSRLGQVGAAHRNASLALALLQEKTTPSRLDRAQIKLSKLLLAELEPRCSFVRVAFAASVLKEESTLKINGRLIERDRWSLRHAVSPGPIRIELAGHDPKTVTATAGRVHGVEFKPIAWATEVVTAPVSTKKIDKTSRVASTKQSWRSLPILPVAAIGLGSSLFITGGVAGIRTSVVAADLENRCGDGCFESVEEANATRQRLAVAGLVLGTGFIATGIVALLLQDSSSGPDKANKTSWTPILSPRSIGLLVRY